MLMRTRIVLALSALGVVAIAGAAVGLRSATGPASDEDVTLEQCPAAVQATIGAHLEGGTIVGIERTTDHGEVLFEVDIRNADGIIEFDVAADGTFRGADRDADDEDDDGDGQGGADEDGDVQVDLAQCPQAVQDTIKKHVGSGSINEIERSPAGNYEVDANGPDGQFEFVVAGDGTYLGSEEDDDDDDDDADND